MADFKKNSKPPHFLFKYLYPRISVAITMLLTVAYGYLCILIFEGQPSFLTLFESLSWSFVMLVPYGIGVLTVSSEFALRKIRKKTKKEPLPEGFMEITIEDALFGPWLGVLWVAGLALVLSFGFLLCFIISIPIVFPAASLGGLTVWLVQKHKKLAMSVLLVAICAPFGLSPVEAQFDKAQKTVYTTTSIHIESNAVTVWNEITTVKPITEDEHHFNWGHLVGIPRPVSAYLDHEGVGGLRSSTFENGLLFEERVIEWDKYNAYRFTIEETSDSLLPRPLDLVDGEVFEIVEGRYEIEQLEDGTVMLHLMSEHYLQTRFNQYGAFWTDQLMRNLQNYILEIIKERAEAATD